MDATEEKVSGRDRKTFPLKSLGRASTESQIQTLYEETFGVRGIRWDDEFLAFDEHVMERSIAFVGRINQHFNRSFDPSVLVEAKTPAALARLIDDLKVSNADFVRIGSTSDALPLFGFAASEESFLGYRTLGGELGSDHPLCILRPPRGPFWESTLDLRLQVTRYVEVIQGAQTRKPYHLIGEGNGGIFAYEVAQQLASRGLHVATLALIDTPGPDVLQLRRSWGVLLRSRIQALNIWIARRLFRERLQKRKTASCSIIRPLSQGRMKSAGEDVVRKRMIHSEMVTKQLIENYVPAPYGGSRVILFRSSKPSPYLRSDLTLGWRSLFPHGGLVVREIPSYHGSMLKQPFVSFLASELKRVVGAIE